MKVFPEQIEFDVASPGEKKVHQALRESPGREDWKILYSLDIRNGIDPHPTEADFVVLAPGFGILFVEVKACQTLSFDGHRWQLGQKTEDRGPYAQARNAMYSVKNFLKENGVEVRNIPFYSAVWFTELNRDRFPVQIERETGETLSYEDLRLDAGQVLERAFANQVSPVQGSLFTARDSDRVHKLLRPRLEIGRAPEREVEIVQNFAARALEEQVLVFESYREQTRVLIDALAGTGKTYVAIQAAKEAAVSGSRVLFVCHNNFLAQHLRNELKEFLNVEVATIKAKMLEVSGLAVPDRLVDGWWDIVLPERAMRALDSAEELDLYDALIIDEAQDVASVANLVFLDALLDGGLAGAERLFFAGDFSHQDLFIDGQAAKANLIEMSGSHLVVVNRAFNKNCRNTHRVGSQIRTWIGLNPSWEGYRRGDDAGRPNLIRADTDDAILREFKKQLDSALKKYPRSSVVVLTQNRSEVEAFLQGFGVRSTYAIDEQTDRVRIGSAYDFKGLEANCVLVVELTGPNSRFREQLYVSGTRSTGDLYLAIDGKKLANAEKREADGES